MTIVFMLFVHCAAHFLIIVIQVVCHNYHSIPTMYTMGALLGFSKTYATLYLIHTLQVQQFQRYPFT